jgi:hypothetical protein
MRIAARFNGPPGSANGGIAAGRLAAYVGAPVVEVTLRRPPPLGVDLRVDASGGTARLLHGDLLVAEAVPCPDPLRTDGPDAGEPVDLDTARAAAPAYAGLVSHPFPTCYVCGPDHPDGMRVFAGPVGAGRSAAVWTPAGDDPVLVWAALDCPGGWSADLPGRPLVLGRMAVAGAGAPAVGEPHVVTGWVRGEEGRKVHTGTALRRADGTVLAVARATWLAVDPSVLAGP